MSNRFVNLGGPGVSSGTAQRPAAAQGMVSAAVCVCVLMCVMATWLFQKFDLRENLRNKTNFL